MGKDQRGGVRGDEVRILTGTEYVVGVRVKLGKVMVGLRSVISLFNTEMIIRFTTKIKINIVAQFVTVIVIKFYQSHVLRSGSLFHQD